MVEAEREIAFLLEKPELVIQTSAFGEMKKALAGVTERAREDEKARPSLLASEQGCPAPAKLDYEPATRGRNDMWAGRLKVEQAVNGIQR